jgi:replicative DNA helicase
MHNFSSIDDSLRNSLDKIDRAEELKNEVIKTGMDPLDRALGGMKRGQLIILGGRPAMGKTALALNIALKIAESNKPVLYFYAEGNKESLANRILLLHSGISSGQLKAGTLPEGGWKQLTKSLNVLSKIPLYISDKNWIDCSEICADVSKMHDVGLIVIDHLQTIKGPVCGLKPAQIVEFIKYHLPTLCAPVLLLSQVERRVDLRKDPSDMTLDDVKDGKSMRELVDKAIFLYRKDYYTKGSFKGPVPMTAAVIDIPMGKMTKVPLIFNKDTGRISSPLIP